MFELRIVSSGEILHIAHFETRELARDDAHRYALKHARAGIEWISFKYHSSEVVWSASDEGEWLYRITEGKELEAMTKPRSTSSIQSCTHEWSETESPENCALCNGRGWYWTDELLGESEGNVPLSQGDAS